MWRPLDGGARSEASASAGRLFAGDRGARGARVGVLVDLTRGPDAGAIRAARLDVERLRASGVAAELRVARSPSQALAAAATLATRGAGTIVVRGADATVLAPLRDRVRLVAR